MRCALKYDDEKMFGEQVVEAWGEMQSLNEQPIYKESELNKANALYFHGYKNAIDDAFNTLQFMIEEEFDEDTDRDDFLEAVKASLAAEICMNLFSILDGQEEDKDE